MKWPDSKNNKSDFGRGVRGTSQNPPILRRGLENENGIGAHIRNREEGGDGRSKNKLAPDRELRSPHESRNGLHCKIAVLRHQGPRRTDKENGHGYRGAGIVRERKGVGRAGGRAVRWDIQGCVGGKHVPYNCCHGRRGTQA